MKSNLYNYPKIANFCILQLICSSSVLEYSLVNFKCDKDLSNEALADICKLATNAFTRLFKNEVGISPQRFVKRKRINSACVMLHHTDYSIDKIASKTGFVNRYHFTRIFTQITGLSPAKYRKEFRIR